MTVKDQKKITCKINAPLLTKNDNWKFNDSPKLTGCMVFVWELICIKYQFVESRSTVELFLNSILIIATTVMWSSGFSKL